MNFKQVQVVNELMSRFDKPWCVAGGWAIDLFIGRETREHGDIEIVIFRKDQLELKIHLKGWCFQKVVEGELQPWGDEVLYLPIHEIHGVNTNGESLEVLLNETKGDEWRYRRNLNISYPLTSVIQFTKTGVPFLCPEVVLLYKMKNTRKKDHWDFMEVEEYLDDEKKSWLKQAIRSCDLDHKWLPLL
ncbi:hypothetical protein LC087_16830 [Bacillus carboniphilus]|uniref:Aminoglycoside-2''-adenylyltransferase n=1 Tax=Bacillus carboniphilus TaxID=86663 RepID=A0ABY9JSH6_9BACI|nr:hypothetical protein [Bacillus carboniphilus]WLR42351.1 hypothetical protein LC087_16830 [Bacillus carboniphilus]